MRTGVVFACLVPVGSVAQITIQTVQVQGELVSPASFFRVGLLNNGSADRATIEGEMKTSAGEVVVSFKADPIAIGPGLRDLGSGELHMREFTYAESDAGRSAKLFHRMPGGNYSYCLRVRSEQAETADQYCDALIVDEIIFLDLVMPWNGDSIEETRPPLTWTASGPPAATNATRVRITVVPMPKDMNAAQAIAAEVPLFHVPDVLQRTMPYPPGVPDLKRGQCYAWQTERLVDGRVLERSEPWSFCVKRQVEPVQEKYARLDRIGEDPIYRAEDERIYFRYDEPYAAPTLPCSILGSDRKPIAPTVVKDGAGQLTANARSVGVNLYELDLSPYQLRTGTYLMTVSDGMGRTYELRFQIPQ